MAIQLPVLLDCFPRLRPGVAMTRPGVIARCDTRRRCRRRNRRGDPEPRRLDCFAFGSRGGGEHIERQREMDTIGPVGRIFASPTGAPTERFFREVLRRDRLAASLWVRGRQHSRCRLRYRGKLRGPRVSVLPRRLSSLTLSVMLEGMRGRRAGFRVTRIGYVVHVDFREVLEWLHGEVGEWRAPMALGFSVRRGTGGTVNLRV